MPVSPGDVPVNTTGHWIASVHRQHRIQASSAVWLGVEGIPSLDAGVNDGLRFGSGFVTIDVATTSDPAVSPLHLTVTASTALVATAGFVALELTPSGGVTDAMPNRTEPNLRSIRGNG